MKLLKNKKILIGLILVIVVGLVVVKMFVLAPPPPDKKQLAKTPGPVYTLADPFVVNLKQEGSTPHFAKIGVALRLSKLSAGLVPKAAGAEAAEMEGEAEVRDIVITAISSMPPSALLAPSGRVKVKHQIIRRVNEDTDIKITDVYYTEFAVQ